MYRIDDIELPMVHPRMAFITGAIDKEIRLSFAQRIKGTLPEPYHPLISEGKEKDIPDFKYLSDSKSIFFNLPFLSGIEKLICQSDTVCQGRE